MQKYTKQIKKYTIKIAYHEKLNESTYEKLMENREIFTILNKKSFFAVKMKKAFKKSTKSEKNMCKLSIGLQVGKTYNAFW